MSRRGRRAGYHNYGLDEQMLLCSVADKYKPIGRNMWEDVATEYNRRRARSWLERDYDPLRRKFRSLYGKAKPTGINGEIPVKLRPIALAQEVQRAIELKGGAQTSHDGLDRGQDDADLLREVAEAEDVASGGRSRHDEVEDNDEDPVIRGSESEDVDEEEEDSQSLMDDLIQYGQGEPDDSQDAATFNVGTVMTSQGNFDTSIGTDVGSDGEEANTPESTETLPPTTRVHVGGTPPESGRPADVNAEAANAPQASCDLDATAGSQPSVTAVVTPVAGGGAGAALRGSHANASAVRAKATGRPKGARRASPSARATFASPDGPALSRDPMRVVDDAHEMQRHSKKSTASNRLGGSDLRVLRDNMSEMNSRVSNSRNKRDSIESSTSGATYASNKRARARKRIEQLQKEMDEVEARQSSAGGDMMQVLVFMREEADRRAETEDRRRREDGEARLAAERQERDERESIRRDEAAAAAAIRLQEMELNRALREEQNKKEAAVAAENRLRYEERLERSRAEARERHEQLMLLISALQRGSQPQQ